MTNAYNVGFLAYRNACATSVSSCALLTFPLPPCLAVLVQLPSKRVCHCVGPIYDPSERDACAQALSGCYRSALEATVKEGLKTIVRRPA